MSRILVLADTPNLYRRTAARYGPDARPDYGCFRQKLLSIGTLRTEAIVNGGVATAFVESLKRLGWIVTFSHADDTDEMLIAKAVQLHRSVDCVVIASGDGKNVELVNLLKTAGKHTVIAGIQGSIHRELYRVADQVADFPIHRTPMAAAAA